LGSTSSTISRSKGKPVLRNWYLLLWKWWFSLFWYWLLILGRKQFLALQWVWFLSFVLESFERQLQSSFQIWCLLCLIVYMIDCSCELWWVSAIVRTESTIDLLPIPLPWLFRWFGHQYMREALHDEELVGEWVFQWSARKCKMLLPDNTDLVAPVKEMFRCILLCWFLFAHVNEYWFQCSWFEPFGNVCIDHFETRMDGVPTWYYLLLLGVLVVGVGDRKFWELLKTKAVDASGPIFALGIL